MVVEEPGVVIVAADGNISTIRTFSHNQVQQLQLPVSFESTRQACTGWQCPRPNLGLIHTADELVIVVSPFESGVCLTKQQVFDGEANSGTASSAVLSLSSFLADKATACTFLGSFNSSDIYISYCLQITSLYSCDLRVNLTEITQSSFVCERLTSLSPSSDPRSIVSNFVLSDQFQVFFWYDNHLFKLKYREGVIRPNSQIEPQSCSRVVFADEMLYHYCDNSSAVITDSEGNEVARSSLTDTGIPFPCAGTHTSFTVRQGPNGTEVTHNGGQTILINGTSLHDAACVVDASNIPVLLLIDRAEGLFTVNSSTMILHHIPEACGGTRNCNNLIVYPDRYVVVLSSGGVATLYKMSVYDGKHLELLRQESLPGKVIGVGVYTSSRTVSPTAPPTDKSTERSESKITTATKSPSRAEPQPVIIVGPIAGFIAIVIM